MGNRSKIYRKEIYFACQLSMNILRLTKGGATIQYFLIDGTASLQYPAWNRENIPRSWVKNRKASLSTQREQFHLVFWLLFFTKYIKETDESCNY